MAEIHVLDDVTIDKIAAGEVVERPASVVKELVENAMDAGAHAVTVEIKEGGIEFIRVTDDGSGIEQNQLRNAFMRHATSKINSVVDLMSLRSMGFRGEALSSIAAVAKVEIVTKTKDDMTGTRLCLEGAKETSFEEVGAPDGTTFIVRNLFFNTPVRRKFLKTAMTEGAHVGDLVEKLALSHPEVSIRFIQNNQNKLYTSGNHNLKDIIYTIFGREIAANLLRVEWQEEILQIRGFAGKPVIARNNRNFENYYINGRYIKSSLVAKAIEEAYKPFMMQHKYPFVLLHLTIEPEYLDVNVHPTKMELRFRDEERIFRIIYQAVSDSLAQKELVPQVSLNKDRKEKQEKNIRQQHHPEPFEVKRLNYYESEQKEKRQTKANEVKAENPQEKDIPEFGNLKTEQKEFKNLKEITKSVKAPTMAPSQETEENRRSESQIQEEKKEAYIIIPSSQTVAEEKGSWNGKARTTSSNTLEQLNFFEEKLLEPKNRFHHKLIGQLFDTYWLVEFNDQLYIIDQHAAHEKVLYEKTMKTLRTREYTSQMLNPPIILTLGSEEQMILEKYRSYFTEIGFEIEHFGGNEYAVRGIPDNLFSIAKKELLMEMIDSLTDDIFKGSPDIIYERVASMSCKAAVKGNHHISFAEADHLIDQLLELENPYTCPHGRPTIISMSKHELERKFKRIV